MQLVLDNVYDGNTKRIKNINMETTVIDAFELGLREIVRKLITFRDPHGEYVCDISNAFNSRHISIHNHTFHSTTVSMLEDVLAARQDLVFHPNCKFLRYCAYYNDLTRVIIDARDDDNEFRFDISGMLSANVDIETFKLLMNARNTDGTHRCDIARDDCFILIEACMHGNVEIAKLCVEAKTDAGDYMCDLDIDNGDPLTYALEFAYRHKKRSYEIVKTLLDARDARGEYRCSINRTHMDTGMNMHESMLTLFLSYSNLDASPRFGFNQEEYVNRALRSKYHDTSPFLSAILAKRNTDGSLYVNLSVPQQRMLIRKAINGEHMKLLELALTLKHNESFQIAEPPNLLMSANNAKNSSILRVVLESRFNSNDRIDDILNCDVLGSRSYPINKGQLFYHICKLSTNLAEFVVNDLAAYT